VGEVGTIAAVRCRPGHREQCGGVDREAQAGNLCQYRTEDGAGKRCCRFHDPEDRADPPERGAGFRCRAAGS
jgi:hypothetical protein